MAQQRASVKGQVTDESGAAAAGVTVTISGAATKSSARTSADGSYLFSTLAPGSYTVQASAPQLALRQPAVIQVPASGTVTLNLVLIVVAEKQQLTVSDTGGPAVSTDAASNASSVVLRGADLDALSDNPDDLAADLLALAGPSAGPNGGSIFIDGFSGGELPPKDSIREIRINQNPFSPEYDRLGLGRIEIFTKPGTDKYHADLGYNFANQALNSRNPYAALKAPFRLNELRETLSGPLGKRASFNVNAVREWVDNGNAVNAVILNPLTLTITPFTGTPVAELRRTLLTPRVDYALSQNHTLSVRCSYSRDIVRNAGTGGLNLVSRGFHNDALSQTVQVTETAVLGASVVNETRFQYFRPKSVAQANTAGYALQVAGAFQAGGAPLGRAVNTQNNYEFQHYTTVLRGAHTLRFGVRMRGAQESSSSEQNFAGTFTFAGGLAPQLDAAERQVTDAQGRPVMVNISSIESYRRARVFQDLGVGSASIRRLGGGATQFSINAGNPVVSVSQVDSGLFVADDWKVRPNLTVSLGLRYEAQNNIGDRLDFAPRVGVAWAPGAKARAKSKSVIRAGFGLFYDRFSSGYVLSARRYDGVNQRQFFLTDPDFFPVVPLVGSLVAGTNTVQRIGEDVRAPLLMQWAVAVERQLPANTTIALTFANTHSPRILRSVVDNAPLPGTYLPAVPGSGVFPLGRPGLAMVTESTGRYNQNQVLVNVNSKVNRDLSLTGSYAYGRAMSNSDGAGTFAANPYRMDGEYGPAATDIHHRVTAGGTISTKWGFRLNPLLSGNSGPPFDITAGRDLYGTSLFNGRPGLATDAGKAGVLRTAYGLLDPNPAAGQALLGRNAGRGPGQVLLNLRVGRTFVFGSSMREGSIAVSPAQTGGGGAGSPPASPFPTGGSAPVAAPSRHYQLTVSMQIRNLTNHNNPGPIIGSIASPLFGQANQPAGSGSGIFSESANNRRMELQIKMAF